MYFKEDEKHEGLLESFPYLVYPDTNNTNTEIVDKNESVETTEKAE